MVAFSRRCRRFVRRRDKVTLAMHGPPKSRQILVRPLTAGTAAASNWRREKTRLAAKKRQPNRIIVYKLIHPDIKPAKTCEWNDRRLRWRHRQSTAGERRCSTAFSPCPR